MPEETEFQRKVVLREWEHLSICLTSENSFVNSRMLHSKNLNAGEHVGKLYFWWDR